MEYFKELLIGFGIGEDTSVFLATVIMITIIVILSVMQIISQRK